MKDLILCRTAGRARRPPSATARRLLLVAALGALLSMEGSRARAAEPDPPAAAAAAEQKERADGLYAEGVTRGDAGDYAGAQAPLELALAIYQELSMHREMLDTLNRLADAAWEVGDFRGSRARREEALAIARKLGLAEDEANILMVLGGVCGALGELGASTDYYAQALAIYQQLGADKDACLTLSTLACDLQRADDPVTARARYEEAVELSRKLGSERDRADVLLNLGSTAHTLSRADKAREHWEQALASYRKLGAEREVATTLHALGCQLADIPYTGLPNWGGAHARFEEELAVYDKLGMQESEEALEALHMLCETERSMCHYQEAAAHLEQGIALTRQAGQERHMLAFMDMLGWVLLDKQDYQAAAQRFEEELALSRELEMRQQEASALFGHAELARRRSDSGRSVDYYEQAASICLSLGDRWGAVVALFDAASVLGKPHEDERVRAYRERAVAICRQPRSLTERAELLHAAARLLCCRADYRTARSCLEEELALWRQLEAEAQPGIGTARALLRLGQAEVRLRGDYRKVITYCQEVATISRRLAVAELQASALRLEAKAYDHLGQYERSRSLLLEALALFQRIGDAAGEARTLEWLAQNAWYRGQMEEVVEYHERMLPVYREAGDRGGEIRALENIGCWAAGVGQLEKAVRCAEESLALSRGYPYDEPSNLCNLGLLYWESGEYEKAEAYLSEALSLPTGGEQAGQLRASILIHAAALATALGQWEKAAGYLEQALAIYEKLDVCAPAARFDKADHAVAATQRAGASALEGSAALAAGLAQYDLATGHSERALSIFRWMEEPGREAGMLITLGEVYMNSGHYEKAEECLSHALAKDSTRDDARLVLAELHMRQGRLAEAKAYLEQAEAPRQAGSKPLSSSRRWDSLRNVLWGRYYLLSGSPAEATGRFEQALEMAGKEMDLLVASQIGLGLAQEALGKWQAAVDAYSQAVARTEQSGAKTRPVDRTRFFEGRAICFRRLEAYEGLVRAWHRLGNDHLAFYWSEHAKARVLTEALAQAPYGAPLGLPAELRKEEDILANRIAALSELAQTTPGQQGQITRELADLRAQQAGLIARLRRDYPAYAAMQYPLPLPADELALAPDEALLAFEVTDQEALAFLVRRRGVEQTFEVPLSRAELEALIQKLRSGLCRVQRPADLKAFDLELGERFYEMLLAPALERVRADERVIVVPDEMIGLLPLQALVAWRSQGTHWIESAHGPCPVGVQYVGDSRVFTYWQSATAMTTARHLGREVPGDRVLLLTDPVVDAAQETASAAVPVGLLAGPPEAAQPARGEAAPMYPVGTHAEVHLRALYGGRLRVLRGAEAREGALKREPLTDYATAVFATHGVVDSDTIALRQPALVLSPVGNEPDDDGYLTMTEVMDLKLSADLVALMACETASGEVTGGEGVMAMGRAFQYAGARSVLASLWKAEDTSADLLTQVFFEQVASGRSKAEALMEARQALREAGYEHPFYWAAFVLIGEDGASSGLSRSRQPSRTAGRPG